MNRKQRRKRLKRLNRPRVAFAVSSYDEDDDMETDDEYWRRKLQEQEESEATVRQRWGAAGIVVAWGFYLLFIDAHKDWWDALYWSLMPVLCTVVIGWLAFWRRPEEDEE